MDIAEIFEAAQAPGPARSRRRFSADLLGMAPDHAADTGLRGAGAAALPHLRERRGAPGRLDLQAPVLDRSLAAGPRRGGAARA